MKLLSTLPELLGILLDAPRGGVGATTGLFCGAKVSFGDDILKTTMKSHPSCFNARAAKKNAR